MPVKVTSLVNRSVALPQQSYTLDPFETKMFADLDALDSDMVTYNGLKVLQSEVVVRFAPDPLDALASQANIDASVEAAVDAIVSDAPTALDTLNELAAALGDDANFAASVTNALALKAADSAVVHKTGDETVAGIKTFSSPPIVPTQSQGDNSTKTATTAFVQTALAGAAGLTLRKTLGAIKLFDGAPTSSVTPNANECHGLCFSIPHEADAFRIVFYNHLTTSFGVQVGVAVADAMTDEKQPKISGATQTLNLMSRGSEGSSASNPIIVQAATATDVIMETPTDWYPISTVAQSASPSSAFRLAYLRFLFPTAQTCPRHTFDSTSLQDVVDNGQGFVLRPYVATGDYLNSNQTGYSAASLSSTYHAPAYRIEFKSRVPTLTIMSYGDSTLMATSTARMNEISRKLALRLNTSSLPASPVNGNSSSGRQMTKYMADAVTGVQTLMPSVCVILAGGRNDTSAYTSGWVNQIRQGLSDLKNVCEQTGTLLVVLPPWPKDNLSSTAHQLRSDLITALTTDAANSLGTMIFENTDSYLATGPSNGRTWITSPTYSANASDPNDAALELVATNLATTLTNAGV